MYGDRFAILREDGDDVAFCESVGEAADVDVGGVAVVGVPRGGWASEKVEFREAQHANIIRQWAAALEVGSHYLHAVLNLTLVELLDLANGVHDLIRGVGVKRAQSKRM